MSERASIAIDQPVAQSNMVARLVDGEPIWVEITPEEQKAYTFKADGVYHLRITGVYEPWTQPKKLEWVKPGGPTEDLLTRLEFEIVSGAGKGKRFASRIAVSLGSRSNLIHVWKATVGPVGRAELTDLLDKELMLFVAKNEVVNATTGETNIYANPTWSTAKPVGKGGDDDEGWDD